MIPMIRSITAFPPPHPASTVDSDTDGLGLLPYDLAGNWRIWDGRIDMGCYEYGSELGCH